MTTIEYAIGKCPVKGCTTRARIHSTTTVTKTYRNRYGSHDYQAPAYVTGLARDHNRHIVTLDDLVRYAYVPHCVEHRRPLRFKAVNGTHNDTVKCDGRCMGATGPNCECSCGGANHGANHG